MNDAFKLVGVRQFFLFVCRSAGVVAWFASLWLPSYQYGKAMSGFECLVYSMLNSFFDAKSPEGNALGLASQIATAANVLFLLLLVLMFRRRTSFKKTKLFGGIGILGLSVVFQIAEKSTTKGEILVGYHIWSLGLVLVGVAAFLEALGSSIDQPLQRGENRTPSAGCRIPRGR